MGPFGSDAELAELLMRTLCDVEPSGVVDLAYLFGNTRDNQRSVIARGVRLHQRWNLKRVGIVDFPNFAGYEGTAAWRNDLLLGGVPASQIIEIPGAHPISHTHTEAERLIARVRDEGWKTIIVVAVPFHQLRAFMDTIGVVLKEGLQEHLRVFSATGFPLSWTDRAVHSQGTVSAPRFELIGPELDRIVRYWKKGDMPTARQVLDYLNWRDGA